MKSISVKTLLIMVATVFTVACSSPRETEVPGAVDINGIPIPTATPVISPVPSGATGGNLKIVASAEIPHLDVHQDVQETLTALGPGLAYSRLLRLRSGQGDNQPNLLLECDLCQSWTLNENLAYVFKLRPDARWQNLAPVHGRPLIADDIVFSLERLKTNGWPNAPLLSSIGSSKALDDLTLEVELSLEDADALLALADGHVKMVASEVVSEYGDLKDAPVIGTGPWIWQDVGHKQGMEFIRNDNYFENGLPFLDGLSVLVIRADALANGPNSSALGKVAAFKTGLVDVLSVEPNEWDLIRKESSDFQSIVSRRSGSGIVLTMNGQTPSLQDASVRKAVFQAIDPWDYLDTVWTGSGFASVGIPVRESGWLLDRQEMRQKFFADPGKARQLLVDSGQELPIDLEVTIRIERTGGENVAMEERLLADLTAVGFNPELRRMDPIQFNELVIGPDREYQLAIGSLPPTSTTNSYLYGLLHSQGQWNLTGHKDTKLDSMIEEQSSEFDDATRKKQLIEIQRHVLDQAYLFSPVTGASRWVFNNDLKGFEPNTALSEYNFWSRTWLNR